jgi:hypothetical protein
MTPAAEKLREFLRTIYAPADRRGVVEWCEDELHLTERQTAMPGKFSTRLTPYMRRPLECFGDPDVHSMSLCWGTQVGKTQMLQSGMAWRVKNKPAPVVWVMPNEKLCKSFSETRWMPLCEDSGALREIMPRDKHKWSKLEQHFAKCSVVFVGSNSPTNLSSRPASVLALDETDKFRRETDRETSAIYLAENRTKSFAGSLTIKTSTPTTPEGEIWQAYLAGSQEKFMLVCPHCGERIELEFKHVKWAQDAKGPDGKWNLARVAETAHYECQRCGGHWNDGQKIEALQTGEWMATNHAAAPGVVSFHLASIYAPWKSCSFGALAVKFLRDKESLNGLRDFTNSTEALPWVEPGAEVGQTEIDARRGDYVLGDPVGEGMSLVAGIDVQQAFSNYVIREVHSGGIGRQLDYGRVGTPEDALAILAGLSGRPLILIDSGFMAERVYAAAMQARRQGLNVYPSKGGQEKFTTRPVRTTDVIMGRQTVKNGLVLYSDNDFKRLLYLDCIRDGKHGWTLASNAGNDYVAEMVKERLVPVQTSRGYEELVWKRVGANHYADSEKLCLVAWWAKYRREASSQSNRAPIRMTVGL